ncbi:MAG: mitomycin resistance protein [Acidobacteria bacterium]|nr:mitomycin resistance protein [Acidobacteriota bacterium]
MLSDFDLLGVQSVADLARRNPDSLFRKLCDLTGTRQDPCVLDTLRCAVAQARDPQLPAEQCNWWFWSRLRKQAKPVAKAAGRDRAAAAGA